MASRMTQFHPNEDLPADFMLIIYGKRRTGKNTLLMHMLQEMRERFEHHTVTVFSGTAGAHPSQYKYFPPASVKADIGMLEQDLAELMDKQMENVHKEVRRQLFARRGGAKLTRESDGKTQMVHTKQGSGDGSGARAFEKTLPADEKKKNLARSKRKRSEKEDILVGGSDKNKKYVVRNGRLVEQTPQTTLELIGNSKKMRSDGDEASNEDDGDEGAESTITDDMVYQALRDDDYEKSLMPHQLIILDDVVDDNKVRYAPTLNKLAVSGRHWFFSVIILSQAVAGSGSVPPIIRINTDCVILVYNPRSMNERKLLSEQYLTPAGADSKQGLMLMSEITRVPYRAMVIDSVNPNSRAYKDFIFMYGPVPAPPGNVDPDFRMGTEKQWNMPIPGMRTPVFDRGQEIFGHRSSENSNYINSGRFKNARTIHNEHKSLDGGPGGGAYKGSAPQTEGVMYLGFNRAIGPQRGNYFNALF